MYLVSHDTPLPLKEHFGMQLISGVDDVQSPWEGLNGRYDILLNVSADLHGHLVYSGIYF